MSIEYVLVSQWVEVLRTKNKDKALLLMDKQNKKWNKYVSYCMENNEPYVDNEVFMYEENI